jgi:DNA-binding HxlR family transcriptional regulator
MNRAGPLPQVDTVIDETEFSILTTVERSQTSLWKKEIHRRVLDSTESIPGLESISIQTISRRVQDLYDQNLLKARLTNTDEVNRTLITTYQLTDRGTEALDAYRESFLKDWALTHLHSRLSESATQPETDPTAIRHIFCDHYDIPRQACSGVAPENILKVLADTFLQGQLEGIVEEEPHTAFTTTLRQHSPELILEDGKT